MRLPWNRKYLEIGFHVILTAGVLVLLGAVVFHLSAAKNVILETARHVLAVFAPFFWSVGIAVVLEPLVAFWQRFYEKRLTAKQKVRVKNRRVGTGITYLLVLGVIALLICGVVRSLGTADLESLAQQAGDFTRQAGDWLTSNSSENSTKPAADHLNHLKLIQNILLFLIRRTNSHGSNNICSVLFLW